MNTTSTQLQHFLIKHFNDFSSKKSNTPFFSTLSRTFISTILDKVHQAHLLWEEHHINILKTEYVYDYQHISNYSHIPEEIRKKYIEPKPREKIFQKKYSIPVGNRLFNLHLWFPITNTFVTEGNATEGKVRKHTILMSHVQIQEKIMDILKKVYIWLHTVCAYLPSHQKCSRFVEIYLFLTEHKKTIPNVTSTQIDEVHANTAFTTSCVQHSTSIFVFRQEEWFKVLMHETFHNLGLDFIKIDHPSINDAIRQVFPVKIDDIRVYEVYAEMWAEIMNVIFLVYDIDPPARKGRLPMNRWISTLERAFVFEQAFSLFQANKILHFNRLKYTDLFQPSLAATYQENTYVFSYFVLKSIWMFHVNIFLEFCAKQPDGISMKFNLSSKNIDSFLSTLVTLAKSELYISEMKKIQEHSIRILDKKKKKDFITNTLRMTVLEKG